VWIAGKQLVGSGRLLHMDESGIKRKAAEWKSRIADSI
jgi:hypothetical protein